MTTLQARYSTIDISFRRGIAAMGLQQVPSGNQFTLQAPLPYLTNAGFPVTDAMKSRRGHEAMGGAIVSVSYREGQDVNAQVTGTHIVGDHANKLLLQCGELPTESPTEIQPRVISLEMLVSTKMSPIPLNELKEQLQGAQVYVGIHSTQ